MKKSRVITTAATLAAASVIGAGLTGFAATDAGATNAADAVAAVQQVAPDAVSDVATSMTADADTAVHAKAPEGGTVQVPKDPSDGVQVITPGNSPDLVIGLPFADQAGDAATSQKDGIVVYDNNNGSSTVPVAHADGSVQISTVIDNANAPGRYDYPITVPEGQTLRLADNGAALVGDDEGNLSLVVAAPWAKDANGDPVATHFEVNGNVLTQVVDFTSATSFPVVADPSVTWLWWGRTIKYTKNETKQIASFANDMSAVSFACAVAGAVGGLICGAVIAIGARVVAVAFRNAANRGRCIQLNIPYVGPGLIYDVAC